MIGVIESIKEVSFSLLNVIVIAIFLSVLNRGIELNKFEKKMFKVAYLALGFGILSSIILVLDKTNII